MSVCRLPACLLGALMAIPAGHTLADDSSSLSGVCEDVKSSVRRRTPAMGLDADPVFSEPPAAPDTESWSVEWQGLTLGFPAEDNGWHYAAFGKGGQRMLQVGLEDRLMIRFSEFDLARKVDSLDAIMTRRGIEPPPDSAFDMLAEGLALAGDSIDCESPEISLVALYGLQLKTALLRSAADRIYRKEQGIVVRSDFGERGESWHLVARHPETRARLLSVQYLDQSDSRPHATLLLLGDRAKSGAPTPSWAFHLFSYIETGGFEHLDWLEQRARDPQQRAAAASVRKVFGRR